MGTLFEKDGLKIERILSKGQVSEPGFWYDQNQDEWVIILQGEAEVEFEESKVILKKGEHLYIPAHKKHRVSHTSQEPPVIWLAIHWN